MNNNKSPGSDGITTECFKIFWNDLKSHYVKSLNYSFENGSLTTLQKQGIISLLPKKDNDLCSLNNWRPLTLLNTDYKIVIKAIANRIRNFYLKLLIVLKQALLRDDILVRISASYKKQLKC